MNIEMKKIKHYASMSEETYCYEAVVYLDGKPFAELRNDGHGGADYVYDHPRSIYSDIQQWRDKLREVETYFNSLPQQQFSYENSDGEIVYDYINQTFESWCHDQVGKHVALQEMRRDLKKSILFIEDGKLYAMKFPLIKKMNSEIAAKIAEKNDELQGKQILNLMDEQDALALFQGV